MKIRTENKGQHENSQSRRTQRSTTVTVLLRASTCAAAIALVSAGAAWAKQPHGDLHGGQHGATHHKTGAGHSGPTTTSTSTMNAGKGMGPAVSHDIKGGARSSAVVGSTMAADSYFDSSSAEPSTSMQNAAGVQAQAGRYDARQGTAHSPNGELGGTHHSHSRRHATNATRPSKRRRRGQRTLAAEPTSRHNVLRSMNRWLLENMAKVELSNVTRGAIRPAIEHLAKQRIATKKAISEKPAAATKEQTHVKQPKRSEKSGIDHDVARFGAVYATKHGHQPASSEHSGRNKPARAKTAQMKTSRFRSDSKQNRRNGGFVVYEKNGFSGVFVPSHRKDVINDMALLAKVFGEDAMPATRKVSNKGWVVECRGQCAKEVLFMPGTHRRVADYLERLAFAMASQLADANLKPEVRRVFKNKHLMHALNDAMSVFVVDRHSIREALKSGNKRLPVSINPRMLIGGKRNSASRRAGPKRASHQQNGRRGGVGEPNANAFDNAA